MVSLPLFQPFLEQKNSKQEVLKMTPKEFSFLCKHHGFSQHGKAYYRCFGEGILQIITTGNRDYLDDRSPERTDKHRKSNRISFYFWSMYEDLPEAFFNDAQYFIGIYPEQLIEKRLNPDFMGLQEQYKLMVSHGFPYLDSIKTQKDLLHAVIDYETIEIGTPNYMNNEIVSAYLLCDEPKEALLRLACLHVQNDMAFHSNNQNLRENKIYDEYFKHLNDHQSKMAYRDHLFWNILLGENESIKEILRQNFRRNCEWAKKYKISFCDNFSLENSNLL